MSDMTMERAKEIIKPFELFKQFPLAWIDKDEHGNFSGMTIAEAYGYLERDEQLRPLIGKLMKSIGVVFNKYVKDYGRDSTVHPEIEALSEILSEAERMGFKAEEQAVKNGGER